MRFITLDLHWKLKMTVFWVVAPHSLVEVYRRLRGVCCLHPLYLLAGLETKYIGSFRTLVRFDFFHGDANNDYLLGCCTVWYFGRLPTFQRNVFPDDGGSMSLWNVGTQPEYLTEQQPRRPSIFLNCCFSRWLWSNSLRPLYLFCPVFSTIRPVSTTAFQYLSCYLLGSSSALPRNIISFFSSPCLHVS
jgi:hypothetical protein